MSYSSYSSFASSTCKSSTITSNLLKFDCLMSLYVAMSDSDALNVEFDVDADVNVFVVTTGPFS